MKLAFYSLTGWSIGKVEREVTSYLPDHWDIKFFDIRETHDKGHFHRLLADGYQFVSPGYPAVVLMKQYDIPAERILFTVYDENELIRTIDALEHEAHSTFEKFIRVGCFSQSCRNLLYSLGFNIDPYLLPLGINVGDYTYKQRDELNVMGYAQKFERSDSAQGFDIKRGNLALEVAKRVDLPLLQTHLTVPGDSGGAQMNEWYQNVDVLLVSSIIEGGPLTPFEGAACGIPTIGTPVGNFYEFAMMGAGILVDTRQQKYVYDTASVIQYLCRDNVAYRDLCQISYETVQFYDWKYQYLDWQEFLDCNY